MGELKYYTEEGFQKLKEELENKVAENCKNLDSVRPPRPGGSISGLSFRFQVEKV